MVLVEATVQIPEQIPEDPRMRHWTFARSDNNAIRLKTIHHMSLDPMTLEPLTGQPYSANLSEEPRRKLDDVSTKIVAKVNMRAVENRARAVAAAHGGANWAVLLIRYYDEGFPKAEKDIELRTAPTHPLTGRAAQTAEALAKMTILKPTTMCRMRSFASVFQVPKNEEVDRAIINCKLINLGFAKPPPLSLAEIGTLLGLVKYFDDATIATADIRHFFWQLQMPEKDGHRFSVFTRGKRYQCAALPMGWSWSPWVAQAIAGLVVAEAAAKMCRKFETHGCAATPRPETFSTPSPWTTRQQSRGSTVERRVTPTSRRSSRSSMTSCGCATVARGPGGSLRRRSRQTNRQRVDRSSRAKSPSARSGSRRTRTSVSTRFS